MRLGQLRNKGSTEFLCYRIQYLHSSLQHRYLYIKLKGELQFTLYWVTKSHKRYSRTFSSTSMLDNVDGQHQVPAILPQGKRTRYLRYNRLGGLRDRSGRVRKSYPTPRFEPRTVQSVAIT